MYDIIPYHRIILMYTYMREQNKIQCEQQGLTVDTNTHVLILKNKMAAKSQTSRKIKIC